MLRTLNHACVVDLIYRGYVADMICQVPARPPTMDLPVFLRDVRLVLPP